ncbi:heterokaryon incompatibility protein-domain-containing protein [Podospora aff. communis PSN243]|uniref:Heterokaryon incompatibility protein-domain-containing protein n=1 Tax=Podospora aff. communis PSN243 TaxID=3040156 RepID=A0AAV9G5H3_9PEZI|nr:heterokaryon incompatibility protein-domain-containing protein [Podospora aff. communis PSN243]
MRLLETSSLAFEEYNDLSLIPSYAILSHTWDKEVTFDDMNGDRESLRRRQGFQKVTNFCLKAREHLLNYAWVDTCCIDKRSSAELSAAINSMYRYYANSAACFIYLSDVDGEDAAQIKKSKGFTRGWTLQELNSPSVRYVFDSTWKPITFAHVTIPRVHGPFLTEVLARASKVPVRVLQQQTLIRTFCVAQCMSWASARKTTRDEDMAYCLMGLFDVHMPILYGEGARNAFRRLQMEIMQTSFDQTIFAWKGPYASSGLLARQPSDFSDCPELAIWGPRFLSPFNMTNIGLSLRVVDVTARNGEVVDRDAPMKAMIQCDVHTERRWGGLTLYLEPLVGAAVQINGAHRRAYRRIRCDELCFVDGDAMSAEPFLDILVLEDEHYLLVLEAGRSD